MKRVRIDKFILFIQSRIDIIEPFPEGDVIVAAHLGGKGHITHPGGPTISSGQRQQQI